MSDRADFIRTLELHYEMIERLKAETVTLQFVVSGLLHEASKTEQGRRIVEAAFDYAIDHAIPHATSENTPGGRYATAAVGMLEHWRKMFEAET